MQKSSIVLLITALCLAGAGSVYADPSDCMLYGSSIYRGNFRVEGDCESYYDCIFSDGKKVTCPSGTKFNYRKQACADAAYVDCSYSPPYENAGAHVLE
ncbi:hypothetical protein INT48_008932 [Thamnidium elegans]|uniref:Chitin-binding type-2 domain-containing protein n=1 Tax=Thamnidium elegans TaxID=101142 RepID=A0A8H7VRD1_9FUNG|nr:hypothetical protein INT48_008932 [Thamnidium elegans]